MTERMARLLAIAALAAPLILAPPAFAQPATASGVATAPRPIALPDWFKEIDTANTGVVTREQYVAYRLKSLDLLDTDKDGVLSKAEFLKLADPPFTTDGPGVPPRAQRLAAYSEQFAALDTNDDGKVTRAEMQVSVALSFREFDIDGDGRATREEVLLVMKTARDRQDEERLQRCRVNPDCNGDGVVDFEEFVNFETARFMARLDPDRDGKISLAAWLVLAGPTTNVPGQPTYQQRRDAVTKRFQEIDTNKDGFIDAAEIRAMLTTSFRRADLDGDGKLTPSEWQIFINAPESSAPVVTPPPPTKPPPGPGPRPAPPAPKPATPTPGGMQPGVPLR